MGKHKLLKKLLMSAAALILCLAMGLTVLAESPDDVEISDEPAASVAEENPGEEPGDAPDEAGEAADTGEAAVAPVSETPEADPTDALPAEDEPAEDEPAEAEPAGAEAAEPMAVLPEDDTSAIVTSYAELKQALGESNGITTVYLGADITTDASGVSVAPDKPFIIIDGQPPGSDIRHTLNQYVSTSTAYTIRVDAAGSKTNAITLRNMVVNGGNYYGIVYVGPSVKGATLVHENIDYTGPQPVYNRDGTTRFVNSRYTLQSTGGVATGELAETLHAEFGGSVTVSAASTANSILWLQGSASTLTVLDGADLTVDTGFYFIYTGGYLPGVSLGAGASLSLTSRTYGFTYADQRVGSVTLAEGASLYIDHDTKTLTTAALRVAKSFTAAPASSVTILRTGADGIPLRLTDAGASVVFDRPDRVFLYAPSNVPLRFTGAGSLSITTSALNLWKTAGWPLAGGLNPLPTHIWNKAGSGLLTLTASYSGTALNSLGHNLTADDPVADPLTAARFNLEGSQLIAFGEMALAIDTLLSSADAITGATAPGAAVSATYTGADGAAAQADGTAGEDGRYSLPVAGGLLPGSMVTTTAAASGLVMRQSATVEDAGSHKLAFLSVPGALQFSSTTVPGAETLVDRAGGPFLITVSDSRLSPTPWRLDASVEHPLAATVAGGQSLLPGAVVFRDGAGKPVPLNEAPYTVFRQSAGTSGTQDIRWDSGEGVLLSLTPGAVYSGVEYTTTIHWTLVDAP